MRLSWDDNDKGKIGWNEWKLWNYIEDTKEQFDLETITALVTKPHKLTVPDEIGVALDSKDNLWVVYRANDGAIYLARANEELNDWVHHEMLIYVPSGSTYPTLEFSDSDQHVIAIEFLPAGSEQKEIWLYEPPYSGEGVRKIVNGQHPLLVKDVQDELYLFYQSPDGAEMYYRRKSEDFSLDHHVDGTTEGILPLGFRLYHQEISPYHDQYRNLLFYKIGDIELPRYKMSSIIDLYTVGVTFIVERGGAVLPGVNVRFNGQTVTTDSQGQATFLKLPYGVTLPFEFSHPLLGEGQKASFNILTEYAGSHVTRQFLFRKPDLKENIYPSFHAGLRWIETQYVDELLTEKISPAVQVGIEWELMLVPIYLMVYSSWEDKFIPLENATVKMSGQISQTNLAGLAPFVEIQANEVYEYTIEHPDYTEVTTGKIQIPEGDFEYLPVKMYQEPWDGKLKEGVQPVLGANLDWVRIYYQEVKHKDVIYPVVGVASILWVEMEGDV